MCQQAILNQSWIIVHGNKWKIQKYLFQENMIDNAVYKMA